LTYYPLTENDKEVEKTDFLLDGESSTMSSKLKSQGVLKMETLVAQMTKEELIQIIESVIERKLLELIDNFDNAELKPEVESRLIYQKEMVAQGERGHAFEDIVQQLDLG
jgi:hypothetical protein